MDCVITEKGGGLVNFKNCLDSFMGTYSVGKTVCFLLVHLLKNDFLKDVRKYLCK